VDTKLVIGASAFVERFSELGHDIVVIDQLFMDTLPHVGTAPVTAVQSVNSAFVVYTSGSTGKPKGVVLEHASVCTSVQAHGTALEIGPKSRVLQFAAYIFDISIQDIFTTLMRGGCVCVPSERDRVNDLAGAINRMGVNCACITPTVASLLRPSDVPGLKKLTLAGEAVTKEVIDIWSGLEKLNNCYGPAESTIYCAWNGAVGKTGMPSNIGRGLASLLWVTQPADHNQLVPVGCVGELLLEGPLLAREYLNDSEKTMASFIEDPTWADLEKSGEHRRMYKTGDLVRYNSNGTLDYLGRKDMQVKIHGQRLEIGEVEYHVKSNLPCVSQVAVELVSAGGRQDGGTLAAFVCFSNSTEIDDDSTQLVMSMPDALQSAMIDLEGLLAQSLPSYMIPTMYIPLKRIPANHSGKTDRAMLRSLVSELSGREMSLYSLANAEKRAPSTQMEEMLQVLWSSVLGISQNMIGAEDSFFRLGGDSITAMRLVKLAREAGVSLTVANIFHFPRLSQMSAAATSLILDAESSTKLSPFALLEGTVSVDDVLDGVF
jgi:amino acid adenylation domain-containing protein